MVVSYELMYSEENIPSEPELKKQKSKLLRELERVTYDILLYHSLVKEIRTRRLR